MKALSFRQPWAELILQGRKTIDLRTWPTNYRGRLVIHASREVDRHICQLYGLEPATLATGALVGTVEVVDMVPLDDQSWETMREQHLKPGPFPGDLLGWRLAQPQRLPHPIPYSGRLKLFNVADDLLEPSAFAEPQPELPSTPPADVSASARRPMPLESQNSSAPQPYQSAPESAFDPNKPFELRVVPDPSGSYGLSLAQWPVVSHGDLPHQPQKLVDLSGDPLRAVADHILAALRQNHYKPTDLSGTRRKPFYLDEETGLRLGLLFLAIKPLTRLDRVEAISSALRVMPSEEAYYWFSKCTAESSAANAQRALRMLLAGE